MTESTTLAQMESSCIEERFYALWGGAAGDLAHMDWRKTLRWRAKDFPVPELPSSTRLALEIDDPAVIDNASPSAAASRLRLSELAPGSVQSEIRAMSVACEMVGGINLAQGVCDTPVPAVVEAEALAAIRRGDNIYTRMDGIGRLRTAIAEKQRRDYGLDYDAETEVMVASGATAGLHAAAMALLNPGDEVILFEPFYGYHTATLKSQRVVPVLVALAEGDFALDADALRAAITPRTRAIVLNTPANPSGKVFTQAETEAVAEVCLEHDLFLFTDEIYEYFVYDGERHVAPA